MQNCRIIAFAIIEGESQQITQSQVLPGLTTVLLEEALQQMQSMQVRSRLFDVVKWGVGSSPDLIATPK